jgi:hypothetical protein
MRVMRYSGLGGELIGGGLHPGFVIAGRGLWVCGTGDPVGLSAGGGRGAGDGPGRDGREIVEEYHFVEENPADSRVFFRETVIFHDPAELPGLAGRPGSPPVTREASVTGATRGLPVGPGARGVAALALEHAALALEHAAPA